MNDILARRARRATVGIALSVVLAAGIAPATAIAAETSSPTGAVALQAEDAAAAKEKAYAAMQEAIRTTLKKGGLLLGYNPRAPGSRLKARARTSSRPIAS